MAPKFVSQHLSQGQAQQQQPPSSQNGAGGIKQSICRNCGEAGHIHKYCTKATLSFGLICFRMHGQEVEYLMIQRKDSLSFMEFVRGKYELNNVAYLKKMFSLMTDEERGILEKSSFENIWNYIWCQNNVPKTSQEYHECRRKFETLREGYFSDGVFVNLKEVLATTNPIYNEPEWGFPKGRRRQRETDLDCAIREFCEETGCISSDFEVLVTNPYRETFLGTNGQAYSHVYFLASMHDYPKREAAVDPKNLGQIREVRKVGWFSAADVVDKIRLYNPERRDIFLLAHKKVCELQNSGAGPYVHGFNNIQPPPGFPQPLPLTTPCSLIKYSPPIQWNWYPAADPSVGPPFPMPMPMQIPIGIPIPIAVCSNM